MKRRNRVSLGKVLLIIFCLMLPFVMNFFSNKYNVDLSDYVFKFLMIICVLTVIIMLVVLFDKKIVVPYKLKRVSAEDLEVIHQFNATAQMSNFSESINDYIEDVMFLCSDFLHMKRKVFSKDFYEDEFLLEEIDGDVELLLLYNNARRVVETVFNYYDDNGKLKKF